MSKPTVENYVTALYDQLLETPRKNQSKLIRSFVLTVKQHDQNNLGKEITEEFYHYSQRKENFVKIFLVSATRLNNLFALSKNISEKLQIDVELTNLVRPDVIGGLIMYYGDYKIDFSLKNVLSRKTASQDFICMDDKLKTIVTIINDQHDLLFAAELPHDKTTRVEIVNITSASKPNLEQIEKELSAILAKKVIINYHTDKKMIGGVIVEYDLKQINQSINHILEKN